MSDSVDYALLSIPFTINRIGIDGVQERVLNIAKGKFAEKKSRFGKLFYGCSNYPECKNAMWTKPYAFGCPKCGHSVMGEKFTKKNGKQLECPKCRHRVEMSETPFASESEDSNEEISL